MKKEIALGGLTMIWLGAAGVNMYYERRAPVTNAILLSRSTPLTRQDVTTAETEADKMMPYGAALIKGVGLEGMLFGAGILGLYLFYGSKKNEQ